MESCFLLAFERLFIRFFLFFTHVRFPSEKGAPADCIVKTNGFKHIFVLCFRAGERRGQQNTHGSGKKTHAKKALKKCVFWHFGGLFFVLANRTAQNTPKRPPRDPPGPSPGPDRSMKSVYVSLLGRSRPDFGPQKGAQVAPKIAQKSTSV